MIQLLYGENDYSLTMSMRRIRDDYLAKHGEHSVALIEGDEATLADLPQLLQGQSLFAENKLVIIRDASENKTFWEGLADALASMSDVDLVLVEKKPDKRTRTFKWLQKNSQLHEYRLLDEREVASWVVNESRSLGINITNDIAKFLVHYSGTDQWRLRGDLEKLSLSREKITESIIKNLIEPHPSASVFDMLDSIISGRHTDALGSLKIIRRNEDPYKFLGLLISQLYALAMCAYADGRSSQQIAKDASIHPYVAQKTLALAKHVDKQQLRSLINRFERADIQLKSTGADPWTILEVAIGSRDL